MKRRPEFADHMQWPQVNFVKAVAKRTAEMSTLRTFFSQYLHVSDYYRSRSEYAGLAITGSLFSLQ